ncbi:MAG: MATE family efflux transporter, partial [Pygmaiobacter sp.]
IGIVFAPQIVSVFRRDDLAVIAIGTVAMRWQCLTLPLWSWVVLCNMMLQTIGKSFGASILALARQGLCFLPAIFLLTALFGLPGLEMSQMVSDLGSFVIALPLGIHVLRELKAVELGAAQ